MEAEPLFVVLSDLRRELSEKHDTAARLAGGDNALGWAEEADRRRTQLYALDLAIKALMDVFRKEDTNAKPT